MPDPNAPKTPKSNDPAPKRRPGRRGGWLKSGNAVDVGRKPTAEVRARILQTVDEATALMDEILAGRFKEEVRDRNSGAVVGHRRANIKEVAAIYRCLCGHALPTQRETVVPEVETDPAFTEHAKRIWEAEAIDKMTREELEWYARIGGMLEAQRIEWENSDGYRKFVEWYRQNGPHRF